MNDFDFPAVQKSNLSVKKSGTDVSLCSGARGIQKAEEGTKNKTGEES